jgi:F-type H+-transporting ATPase subunit epsilon
MASSHPAFDLEVITPDGASFKGRAASLRLQGKEGNFGILARHAPLIGVLDIGVARIELESGARENLALGEGFVEVRKKGVRVLVDFCNASKQIDVARAEAAAERARERLKSRDKKIDDARAEAALRRAMVRITVGRGVEV